VSEHLLDERGRACPYPVIALGRLWQQLHSQPGEHIVDITADDPVAVIDIPAWCHIKGADYERLDDAGGPDIRFRVRFTGSTQA